MSFYNKTKLVLGAILAVSAMAAQAQGYVAVSAGSSKHDLDCGGTISCDNNGSGFKLLGGYKFNPNVAIEGGYLSFGKASSQVFASIPSLGTGVYGLSLKNSGPAIGVAFHAPIATSWKLVGRLGLYQSKTKASLATPNGLTGSDSESSGQLYGGLGVGYAVTPQVSIDAGWDFSKAKYAGESYSLNMFSLGLSFGF